MICAFVGARIWWSLDDLSQPVELEPKETHGVYRISRKKGTASFCTPVAGIHRHWFLSVWRHVKRHFACATDITGNGSRPTIHTVGTKFCQDCGFALELVELQGVISGESVWLIEYILIVCGSIYLAFAWL